MFKDLLTTTFRSLSRNKLYSFINVFGLSVGIASCLVIWMYVENQLSYDRFHTHVDDIYRVIRIQGPSENREHAGVSEAPMGPTLMADYPEVIDYVRVNETGPLLVKHGATNLNVDRTLMAGESFFKMFSFPLLAGDATAALDAPMKVVLTESSARALFGDVGSALNQTIEIRQVPMNVAAVCEDPPENSSVQFDLLLSFITARAMGRDLDTWHGDWLTTFVQLRPGTDVSTINARMDGFLKQYMPERHEGKNQLYLHPFADSHLGSMHITFGDGITSTSDIVYVYVFSAVAVFMVVIACINFMNLTTARSARRAGEIGVRKVVGAARSQLVRQFLGESCSISLMSFALAVGIVEWIAPRFAAEFDTPLDVTRMFEWGYLPYTLAFVVLTGLFAGIYPAVYLSGFRPIQILKDRATPRSSGVLIRKFLVVTQFTISAALIIGTGLVLRQFEYLRERNLGFNTEQIVVINVPDPPAMKDRLDTFKTRTLEIPGVLRAAASSVTIGQNFISGGGAAFEKDDGEIKWINARRMTVDHDFVSTYGIQLASGRDFDRDASADARSFASDNWHQEGVYLVNEEFARRYGFGDPTGNRLRMPNGGAFGEIVGVVRDFNFYTLHHQIEVLAIRLGPADMYHRVGLKVSPDNIRQTMQEIESIWKETYDLPMAYTFQDDFFARQYRREEMTGTLVTAFSAIAILIACLGLVGLAAYTAERRTREIGIRKALGASVPGISILLSSQYLRLVLVANVLAWPIAYYGIQNWLKDFAYRVEIGPLAFVEGALALVLIALATVAWQAIRAASTSPVDALKYE